MCRVDAGVEIYRARAGSARVSVEWLELHGTDATDDSFRQALVEAVIQTLHLPLDTRVTIRRGCLKPG